MANVRATQSDRSSHSQMPSLGRAESPCPFLGPFGPLPAARPLGPGPWALGHPPLRCQGSLRCQKCWSPPAAAVPPPDGSGGTDPYREPAEHPGWMSVLASQADSLHALPRHPALGSLSSALSPGACHGGGKYLTSPCQPNLFAHSVLGSLTLPRLAHQPALGGSASKTLHVPHHVLPLAPLFRIPRMRTYFSQKQDEWVTKLLNSFGILETQMLCLKLISGETRQGLRFLPRPA